MFLDTWSSLSVDVTAIDAVSALRDYLLSLPLDADLQSDPAVGVHATAAPALRGLVSDPRNADRMSNASVALFDLGISSDQTIKAREIFGPQDVWGSFLEVRALALLREVDAAFPPNRTVFVNRAYLTSVLPTGCAASTANIQTALALASKWLGQAPDDVVARVLVGNLQARDSVKLTDALIPGNTDQPLALASALATLDVLTKSNATTALGSAAKGDAYMAAASALATQAPYESRRYAELARLAYVSALGKIDDPGLRAAEAAALNFTGDTDSALASQRAAVALAPDSAELALGLAFQLERAGDFNGMRAAAQQALKLSLAGNNPLFHEARFVAAGGVGTGVPIPGDRGYEGYSFGSDRARVPVYVTEGGCGGGGFVTTDAIPALDDPEIDDAAHFRPLPDAAVMTALAASLVLSDSSAADADAQQWTKLPGTNPAAEVDKEWVARRHRVEIALQATHLVADRSPGQGPDLGAAAFFAESNLRHSANAAGKVRLFARAAAICRMEARGEGALGALDKETRSRGLLCEGESAYHAGDYVSAAAALEASYNSTGQFPLEGVEAAIAMWKAGQLETARHLLLKVLSGQDPKDSNYLGAHEILGELLLDEGDPRAAIDRFEETLNGVPDWLKPRVTSADRFTATVRLVAQHAYNNHGVALLWRAQNAPGAAPDCGHDGSVCQQAREDFAAAISMDPNNPYYLQNAAWSDRLLNRLPASRIELAAAAAADPSDYPALNDLGVMAAVDGDLTAAQHAFQASLQARPDYDLAAWNLGVVDMQLGPYSVVAAQGYFARAIKENQQLRGNPLEYLADNRIYRAAYGQPLQPSLSTVTVRGYSSAALATGGIAALSALDDATGVEIKAKLTELFRDIKLPVKADVIGPLRLWVLRRRSVPQRLPSGVRIWLPTSLVLVIGTVWAVLSRQGQAVGSELVLAVFATALAVLVHECGHLIAACAARIRVAPAASPLGILMSVLLLPLRISSGPYSGHRSLPGTSLKRARWVYLAGPVANLLVAGAAYGLYLAQPLPLLQLIAGVQLAAAGFSLLPLEPLDGAGLGKGRAEHAAAFSLLAAGLALIAGLGGAAISLGKL